MLQQVQQYPLHNAYKASRQVPSLYSAEVRCKINQIQYQIITLSQILSGLTFQKSLYHDYESQRCLSEWASVSPTTKLPTTSVHVVLHSTITLKSPPAKGVHWESLYHTLRIYCRTVPLNLKCRGGSHNPCSKTAGAKNQLFICRLLWQTTLRCE